MIKKEQTTKKRKGEEIDLSEEDDRILDAIWDRVGREMKAKRQSNAGK